MKVSFSGFLDIWCDMTCPEMSKNVLKSNKGKAYIYHFKIIPVQKSLSRRISFVDGYLIVLESYFAYTSTRNSIFKNVTSLEI